MRATRPMRTVRERARLLAGGCLPLLAAASVAFAGGSLLWDGGLHGERGFASGEKIAADGGRVFVAAVLADSSGQTDLVVQAFDAARGTLLWEDRYDRAGEPDSGIDIAAAAGRVVVAGLAGDAAGNVDYMVRAYDAASGTLLWQDLHDEAGLHDVATSVAVHGSHVFTAGQVESSSGNLDFVVRAYDATSGRVSWQHRLDPSGGLDAAFGVATEGGLVFAAGYVTNDAGNYDFFVQCFAARNGDLIWTEQLDKGGSAGDVAVGVIAAGGRVYAYGQSGKTARTADFLVRAYDATTGALLWEDDHDVAGFHDSAVDAAVHGGRLFVVGQGRRSLYSSDLLVRAYDAAGGASLWTDLFDLADSVDDAAAVAADRGFAYVVGSGRNDSGDVDMLVRAYVARSGELAWMSQVDRSHGNDAARDVLAAGGRVIVAGFEQEAGSGAPGTHADCVVRSYDGR